MDALISSGIGFLSEHASWIIGFSFASLVAAAVLVPVLVKRIPVDYFSHSRRHRLVASSRYPALNFALTSAKNLLGATLVLAGLLMLFVPGQGLITLLVGLMIMNYPGKFALERWLMRRPHVFSAVNWLRIRHGQPPLEPPGQTE
jgi:hypothetical protein